MAKKQSTTEQLAKYAAAMGIQRIDCPKEAFVIPVQVPCTCNYEKFPHVHVYTEGLRLMEGWIDVVCREGKIVDFTPIQDDDIPF